MTNEQLHKAAVLIAALDSDGADAVLERIMQYGQNYDAAWREG